MDEMDVSLPPALLGLPPSFTTASRFCCALADASGAISGEAACRQKTKKKEDVGSCSADFTLCTTRSHGERQKIETIQKVPS